MFVLFALLTRKSKYIYFRWLYASNQHKMKDVLILLDLCAWGTGMTLHKYIINASSALQFC